MSTTSSPSSPTRARALPTITHAASARLRSAKRALWDRRIAHAHRRDSVRTDHARLYITSDSDDYSLTLDVITRVRLVLEDVALDLEAQEIDLEAMRIDMESNALDDVGTRGYSHHGPLVNGDYSEVGARNNPHRNHQVNGNYNEGDEVGDEVMEQDFWQRCREDMEQRFSILNERHGLVSNALEIAENARMRREQAIAGYE